MTLSGILLDIDGTLILSNDIQAKAWVEAFADFGYEVSFEQVRSLIGMGGDQLIPLVMPELSSEEGDGKQISDRRKTLVMEKFSSELKPSNGARSFVTKLLEDGFQIVIASSATNEELGILLKAAQVEDLLQDIPKTTTDDAESSKPAPDLIQAALQKGNFQPDQVVMVGDAPYDIEAASKAGVAVIAFRCGGFSDQQLKGAIAIYDDPADLLSQYDRSPFATKILNAVG